MNVQNLQTLATVLPALAPLASGADHTAQRGRTLKLYRPEVKQTPELTAAVVELLKLGVKVRIHSRNVITTPTLAADSAVVWTDRASRKVRKTVKVEVVL